MNDTMLKLRIWARAEATLGRIHLRRTGQRATMIVVAVGLILLTVAMANVGAYELLAESQGKARGAFVLAGVNALLAFLVLLASRRTGPSPEEEMVREIRQMAVAELSADAEAVREEFVRLSGHVRRIEDGLSALSGAGTSSLAVISTVGPLLDLIVKSLRRRKST